VGSQQQLLCKEEILDKMVHAMPDINLARSEKKYSVKMQFLDNIGNPKFLITFSAEHSFVK
jgi:lantibiotic modifying enzyme